MPGLRIQSCVAIAKDFVAWSARERMTSICIYKCMYITVYIYMCVNIHILIYFVHIVLKIQFMSTVA